MAHPNASLPAIALGPAASQIAIKQLGTNGGGFFNVNSAHPFENPTPLSNFLEMLAILLIPAALCYTFGKMLGDARQGWALLATMAIMFIALLAATYALETPGNPALSTLGVDQVASATNPGANMEGKETRFGISNSVIWAIATTAHRPTTAARPARKERIPWATVTFARTEPTLPFGRHAPLRHCQR